MIHEFVCCEQMPVSGLSAAELTTPPGVLLFGANYFSMHPSNVLLEAADGSAGSCLLGCKQQATVLDIFSSCGGAIATKPMPKSSNSSNSNNSNSNNSNNKSSNSNSTDSSSSSSSSKCSSGADAMGEAQQMQENLVAWLAPIINIDTCEVRFVPALQS